jgi:hypothetical protein
MEEEPSWLTNEDDYNEKFYPQDKPEKQDPDNPEFYTGDLDD